MKIAALPLQTWGGWGWYINGRMLVSGRSLARLRLTVLFYLCEFQPPAWKKMALSVSDWLVEAESLLEKKSVNEAVDLLNRIGESNLHA